MIADFIIVSVSFLLIILAANLVKGFTDDEIALAVSINRGKQITKDTPQKIINLSNNIKSYLDEVKTLHSDAGFFAKKEKIEINKQL